MTASKKRKIVTIPWWRGLSDSNLTGTCTTTSRDFRIVDGQIWKRNGSSSINTDAGTTPRKNIFSWKRVEQDKVTLIAQYGAEVQAYIESQHAFVTIPSAITSTERQYYENYRNEMVIVNGEDLLGRLQEVDILFAAAPTIGDTSETLVENWAYATGAYPVDFKNGEYRLVTLTSGATTCTWTGALTADASLNEKTIAFDNPATNLRINATVEFASAPSPGDTSETLASPWLHDTGVYQVFFTDGSPSGALRDVTLTYGATTCTWTGALPAGTYPTSETTIIGFEHPEFILLTKKQFFTWTKEHPNQIKWGDYEATDGTGVLIYQFNIDTGKAGGVQSLNGKLTGLANLSSSSWLLSTDSNLFTISYRLLSDDTYYPEINPLFSGIGAANPRCIKSANGTCTLLSTNNKICFVSSTDSGLIIDTKIADGSDKKPGIKTLLATLKDDQSEAFIDFDPEEKIFWYFVTQAGFSYPNIAIGFDTKNNEWLCDSKSYIASTIHNDKLYLADTLTSQVYLDNNGAADKDDQDIFMSYKTTPIDLDLPVDRKQWYRTLVPTYLGSSTTLSEQIIVNPFLSSEYEYSGVSGASSGAVGTYAVGTIAVGAADSSEELSFVPMVIATQFRGYSMQMLFENSGTAQKLIIDKGANIEYRTLPRTIIPYNIKK